MRAILYALLKAQDYGFYEICVLLDAKEVVDTTKGSVNPIVLILKPCALLSCLLVLFFPHLNV